MGNSGELESEASAFLQGLRRDLHACRCANRPVSACVQLSLQYSMRASTVADPEGPLLPLPFRESLLSIKVEDSASFFYASGSLISSISNVHLYYTPHDSRSYSAYNRKPPIEVCYRINCSILHTRLEFSSFHPVYSWRTVRRLTVGARAILALQFLHLQNSSVASPFFQYSQILL